MDRRPAAARSLLVVATCALMTTACGGAQDTEVAEAATRLLSAARRGDGAAACAVLAPAVRTEIADTSGKPCADAILEESLGDGSGPVEVEVFDTAAEVVVGSEVMFLSRFDGQWLVIAAACTPVPDQPYDCSVGMP